MSTPSDWLLVPMEVAALVVGEDAVSTSETSGWCSLAPDFSRIKRQLFFQGPDLVTPFAQDATPKPLPEGIHLHWFLPAAYGRADEKTGTYPYIPNRWLVRRLRRARGAVAIEDVTNWIVESDWLPEAIPPAGSGGTAVPSRDPLPWLVDPVGRVTPLKTWKETSPTYRFKLTAAGYGSHDFAAHYPSCKDVLGFFDPLTDCQAGAWDLSYLVNGWCSDPSVDLLHGIDAARWTKVPEAKDGGTSVLAEHQWRVAHFDPASVPDRVACHGATNRVLWDPSSNKHQSPVPPGTADVRVTIGHNAVEALSALLARHLEDGANDPAALAPLLAAFQYDLLGNEDHLHDLSSELHRRRFAVLPGGDRYTIAAARRPIESQGSASDTVTVNPGPTPPAPAPYLPPDIVAALQDLNTKARESALRQGEMNSRQQALFTAWSLWARRFLDEGTQPTNKPLQNCRAAVTTAIAARDQAERDHLSARSELENTLSVRLPDLTLARGTAEPFHRPFDPAVLVSGPGLAPSGIPDPYHRAEELTCRKYADLVRGFTAECADLPALDLRGNDLCANLPPSLNNEGGPPAEILDGLLEELLVLDPVPAQPGSKGGPLADAFAAAVQRKAEVTLSSSLLSALGAALAGLSAGTAATSSLLRYRGATPEALPQRPESLAVIPWSRNPWRPVFLQWEVDWHPDDGLGGTTPLKDAWKAWRMRPDGEEFDEGSRRPATTTAPIAYQAITTLAPHAAWVLRRRLESLLDRQASTQLQAVLATVDRLEILGAPLEGFHDALRQLRRGLQLPPLSPDYVQTDSTSEPLTWEKIGDPLFRDAPPDPLHRRTPLREIPPGTLRDFQPIRAGMLALRRLWIVDSFGQTRRIALPAQGDPQAVTLAIPPRFAQPARLDFQWQADHCQSPAGSPLCGWIFPNHLDQSLMVCDAGGHLLGALQAIVRAVPAGGTGARPDPTARAFFWVPVPGKDTKPTDILSEQLRTFVTRLLALGADAGAEFLRATRTALADSATAPEADPRLSILIGKPLALARASLQIQLLGLPLRDVRTEYPNPATPENPTRGFTKVPFPVRLGGPAGAAGGLIGYFVAGESAAFHPRYGLDGANIAGAIEYGHEFAIDAESPRAVTLLLDPTGPVHARCGVLPRTSLPLPPELAAGTSLIRDVFFQSAPILGPAGGPRLPRPSDDYGQWSWATRPQVASWQEYPEFSDAGTAGAFADAPLQLQEGWLKLQMNPVNIAGFWVKEGESTISAGTQLTLGWKVDGADTLTLTAEGSEAPLRSWDWQDSATLPEDCTLKITTSVKLILTATDRRGNRSQKTLQLAVK